MKVLLVTEKCSPQENQRDGGARLVDTLQRALGDSLSIMQFGSRADDSFARWYFEYPFDFSDRFQRRMANADFIAEKVKAVAQHFTHVIFIHISMQFGFVNFPLKEEIEIWTFPMFLTPSYRASGESVPDAYFEMERLTLKNSQNILTPSYLEKKQLIEIYSVEDKCIHVVPRGIDSRFLNPKIRKLSGPPKFCSIGSIKPQKNICGLIALFAKIQAKFPEATLKMIGPIQNASYYSTIQQDIQRLGLSQRIECLGYLSPDKLGLAIQDAHLHLSTSTCETFGRSIFETLASGLPNIARASGNAAAEFLENVPYAKFTDHHEEALMIIEEMLANLSKLSSMALEVGTLFNDEILSKLLLAKICRSPSIGISDFDGTLYHKDDPAKTQRCLTAFRHFPVRILCSARPLDNLIEQLKLYDLQVDWIVACSGSHVANGLGQTLWHTPLDFVYLEGKRIESEGKLLQISMPAEQLSRIEVLGLRVEVYQNTAFIAHWQASKLRAVHRLLRFINWSGQISAFGDGPYDVEMLNYFDGTRLKNKEVFHG